MARYDYGFRPGPGYGPPRSRGYDRPWAGGYRTGYPGGPGGVPMNTGGRAARQRDLWWMANRADADRQSRYDAAYEDFNRRTHPRYSPVGGMYSAMGGSYIKGGAPRPLGYDQWFSEWTRWF